MAALLALAPALLVVGEIVTSFHLFGKSVAQFEQALTSGTQKPVVAAAAGIGAAQRTFFRTLDDIQARLRARGIPLPGP